MIWLRRHRADVLGAIALAARGKEPLGPSLSRLAEVDGSLKRWADRIAPRLHAGEPLAVVLRRERLIRTDEASDLAAARDPAHELHRLAARAQEPPLWIWPLTHPGTAILILMFAPMLAFVALRTMTGGLLVPGYIKDLNVALATPDLSILAFGALLAVFEHGIGRVRGLRHLRALWCAEILREQALLRLLHAARTDDQREIALPIWARILSSCGGWPHRHHRPIWDTDWRTWRALTWCRLDKATRLAADQTPSLTQRLQLCGVVAQGASGPEWRCADEACRERLLTAVVRKRTIVRPVLLLSACLGAFLLFGAIFMNIFTILMELGKQG